MAMEYVEGKTLQDVLEEGEHAREELAGDPDRGRAGAGGRAPGRGSSTGTSSPPT